MESKILKNLLLLVIDVFQGHTNFSPAIISCTTPECLLLEYGGYKTYIDTQRKEKHHGGLW